MSIINPSTHPADILREAIKHEEKSIQFYQNAMDAVTDPGTKKMLQELIKEERKHKNFLEEELDKGGYPEN